MFKDNALNLAREASQKMEELERQGVALDRPMVIEETEEHKFVFMPGKHGRICGIVPKSPPSLGEKEKFYRLLAEMAINDEIKKLKGD
jgi:hypothetical protein